jgi:MYND finger
VEVAAERGVRIDAETEAETGGKTGAETVSDTTTAAVQDRGIPLDRCASSQWGLVLSASTRMVCSGCRRVFYCSKVCQLMDWKAGHKKACKQSQSQGQRQGRKEK